jgi:hypothetical protein
LKKIDYEQVKKNVEQPIEATGPGMYWISGDDGFEAGVRNRSHACNRQLVDSSVQLEAIMARCTTR